MISEIERYKQIIEDLKTKNDKLQQTINEYKKQNNLLQQEVDKLNNELELENNEEEEENWEEDNEVYSEIAYENKFLKKRVIDLEQSYETINEELKRIKQKYEVSDLERFMNLYGSVADRCDIKVIQNNYFETTGIKYSITKLKEELESIGYQVKKNGNKNTYYITKDVRGYLYIVQLLKHKNTDIYKVGKTYQMKQRLNTYKRFDGGAVEIICKPVNNKEKAEAKFLQLLNEAVDRNELKKNEYGNEYFEGPLDVIKKYYNQVIDAI